MRGKVREMKTGKTRRGITPRMRGKEIANSDELAVEGSPRVCGEKS